MTTDDLMSQIKQTAERTEQEEQYVACGECKGIQPFTGPKPPEVCALCEEKPTKVGIGADMVSAKKALNELLKEKPEKRKRIKSKEEVVPVEEIEEPVAMTPKEKRQAATNAFIEKAGVNETDYVSCGLADVYSVGFTVWNDGLPGYRFIETFEDGKDFGPKLDAARREHGPTIQMDVAWLTNIQCDDVLPCLFQGILVASTKSNRGPISVKRGDRVEYGVKKTAKGSLIFQIIKVVR